MAIDVTQVPVMEWRAHCFVCDASMRGDEHMARVWKRQHVCPPWEDPFKPLEMTPERLGAVEAAERAARPVGEAE